MLTRIFIACWSMLFLSFSGQGWAQENCITYKLVPQTSYKIQPHTVSKLVCETAYKTQQITTYKPVWTRETRQRTTVSYKPVTKTSQRVERYLVRRPITETSYRERKIQETTYETVTEMQEQRYLVEKPVIETQLREEKILVRKPVTTTMMQTENVTSFKPTTVTETQYIQGANIRTDLCVQTGRNRLRWLRPGNYVDPTTGQARFQQRGLHWVPDQNLLLRPTIEPTLIPQQVSRTTYVPETVQVQKPVQVTKYVDQLETRKVPVQVSTTSKSIQVLKIPVTVQKPVTRIRTEKVPVSEVKYREEIYERRVPVTETSYQRVEQIEPYEVDVCKWVAENQLVQVPNNVTRRVDYSVNQVVPETKWIRVPVDAWGNVVAAPPIVATESPTIFDVADRMSAIPIRESGLMNDVQSTTLGSETVVGKPIIRRLSDEEFNRLNKTLKPSSIMFPETQTDSGNAETDTVSVADRRPTIAGDAGESDDPEFATDEANRDTPILDVPPPAMPETTVDLQLDDSSDIDSRPSDEIDDDDVRLEGSS